MIEKLTPADLDRMRSTSRNPECVEFMQGLRVGQGGRVVVADVGRVAAITVKNRISKAATVAGVEIKYLRSKPDVVVFEVVSKKAYTWLDVHNVHGH